MQKTLILLTLLIALPSHAQEEVSTYGDLFLIEEKIQMEDTLEFQLLGGNVINNSAFEVISAHFNIQYHVTNYFNIGPSLGYNSLKESQNFIAIENEIKDEGTIKAFYPEKEILLKLGFLPLKGNLNLFNSGSISYYLFADFSIGAVQIEDFYLGGNTAIGLKIDLSNYLSLLTGYRQNAYFLDTGTELSGSAIFGLSVNLR